MRIYLRLTILPKKCTIFPPAWVTFVKCGNHSLRAESQTGSQRVLRDAQCWCWSFKGICWQSEKYILDCSIFNRNTDDIFFWLLLSFTLSHLYCSSQMPLYHFRRRGRSSSQTSNDGKKNVCLKFQCEVQCPHRSTQILCIRVWWTLMPHAQDH